MMKKYFTIINVFITAKYSFIALVKDFNKRKEKKEKNESKGDLAVASKISIRKDRQQISGACKKFSADILCMITAMQ